MKKKAYIIPRTNVMIEDSECLMLTVSAGLDGIFSDENPDMGDDDNRSRRTYSVWEEE